MRESKASRKNRDIVYATAKKVITDDPSALLNPFLASIVVDRLKRDEPSALAYMDRYCGSANAEVSAILDQTVRQKSIYKFG